VVNLSRHSRRGAGSLGCLFSLALFAGALYYGVNNGQADSLFGGAPKPHFKVSRNKDQKRIIIETEYNDQVDLPLFKHTFVLRPRAEEAL